jgi:ABC-type histidine transport system ATPase subunit
MFHTCRGALDEAKVIVCTWCSVSQQEILLIQLIASALMAREQRLEVLETHGVTALVELSDALSFLHRGEVEEATSRIERAMRSLDVLSAS